MNKPLTMVIDETKQTLISTINGTNLPPVIMEMLIKDIYTEIVAINNSVKTQEKEAYLKSLEEPTEE